MIRKLTSRDLDLVKKILPPSKVDLFSTTYFTNLKTWHAFGYFKDNELKGISTTYFSSDDIEWFLLTQYADRGEDMKQMVYEVCKYYEQKKIFKFFWLDADHYVDFLKNFIPEQYLHFKEFSVSPFQLPKTPRQFYILYDQKMFPVNTHVYMSALPDEFRI